MEDGARIGLALLLGLLITLLAAFIITRSRARRIVGSVVALATFAPDWLVPKEHSVWRFLLCLFAIAGFLRSIDLVRGEWSLGARLVHVLSIVDTRRLESVSPSFERRPFLAGLGWAGLALASYAGLLIESRFAGWAFWAVRWGSGLGLIYGLSSASYGWLAVGYRAVGLRTEPLHILPLASRSVQEFWGVRWNRTVGVWLRETCFLPLARRRLAALGALLAFFVSALLHAYLALVSVSWTMAALMLAYFLSQAVVLGLERALVVRRWPAWSAHVWTVGCMVALSPGFTEPFVRAAGF